ncbi:uncharacterized protein BCR38DRAFT_331655 [Pseudomassariella vexata]|uniref:TauD/TfdA-like domain-containing protein n=1 Tax=Pseudomassariella vexata TaxID=1141098 RepID=A0A1Y2EID1_9PEZI|nr:uncharacterized protein BCR38DRAFT_331655 [Pseudomassariella vexata]ORY71330.1 hypothetical protein BCR38DRAFT_331655 [Pseudomassariella vexata]
MTAQIQLPSQLSAGTHWQVHGDHESIRAGVEAQRSWSIQSPAGFPPVINGPTACPVSDSDLCGVHILNLNGQDVVEIENGLRSFKGLGMDGDDVTRERFPLPNLQKRLDGCAAEIHDGTGLCIIRGLDPRRYSVEDNIMIFLGVSSYIGGKRGLQNSKGAMLTHVTESKLWSVPREKRHGIHTNESLPFHSDMGCDILSLHVRQCAETGGRTCVASSADIYNHLAQTNPLAVHALARPDWPIQTCHTGASFVLSPLLAYHKDKLILSVDPCRVGPPPSACAGPVPSLTTEQHDALAALQMAAHENQVPIDSQPGDFVYINNWSMLHAREPYQDGETSARHLVRMWLRNEALAWEIPTSMRVPWESSFGETAKRVTNREYPIVPMPEYKESKYTAGTAAFVPEDDDDYHWCDRNVR